MAHIYVVEYLYFLKMVCVYVWFMTLNHSEVGMSMLTSDGLLGIIVFVAACWDRRLVYALRVSSSSWNPAIVSFQSGHDLIPAMSLPLLRRTLLLTPPSPSKLEVRNLSPESMATKNLLPGVLRSYFRRLQIKPSRRRMKRSSIKEQQWSNFSGGPLHGSWIHQVN
ncbi:hypothetical protein YC2023_050003 [Brassica napus]